MSDTSGPTSGMPLAQYDRESQCWKTSEATSLWALPMSSLTLPTWGGLRDGVLYEQQRPERRIIEPDSSSLPTPNARDYKGSPGPGWSGQASLPRAVTMLPTPKAADGERGRDLPRMRADTASRELSTTLGHLLPTPTAQAAKHGSTPDIHANGFGKNLWDLPHLLPTPAVNDMGAGKDPEAWAEWAARQKAADGTPAPHGKSLEQEALKMLPTPKSSRGGAESTTTRPSGSKGSTNLHGAITLQQSGDGSQSQDDPRQPPLFSETGEIV